VLASWADLKFPNRGLHEAVLKAAAARARLRPESAIFI